MSQLPTLLEFSSNCSSLVAYLETVNLQQHSRVKLREGLGGKNEIHKGVSLPSAFPLGSTCQLSL